jgi:chromosome segregation ATPase
MHLKLSKFEKRNKDLNEEAAKLDSECMSLKEELEHVKLERDELSEEALLLQAQAEEHRREEARFEPIVRRMLELEQQNLESQKAIHTRDNMVEELASQLEQTLDQLEVARARQQQRRNIFFPRSEELVK